MNLKLVLSFFLIGTSFLLSAQKKRVKKISFPEKIWAISHPFVVKKAYKITLHTRAVVRQVKSDSVLIGRGNGLQVDAFRHTYWMATLTREIGWRRARSLGKAHERGNYKTYKKRKEEDGVNS